ncbi:MAG: HNH endonuclease [Candidatus Omnitrophica bacterium]|nr:HNH endonuclease [Candidatus Omnitrophota bacterium]
MNFHLRGGMSVILMSLRPGAPYNDRIDNQGRTLIYEGHDIYKDSVNIDPKLIDQPMNNPNGTLTQNGLFFEAAQKYKNNQDEEEFVKVYEKIYAGIWTYNGLFKLVDAWQENYNGRQVFKFRLELVDDNKDVSLKDRDVDHNRIIPSSVKLEVWKRDKGKCVKCQSTDNLHFDHIIPYSLGGSSLVAENIQLLCARHNIEKRDRIE